MNSFHAHGLLAIAGSLCVLLLPFRSPSQPVTPGPRLGAEVMTSYTDALRYASDRLRGTIFSRQMSGGVHIFWPSDTVSICLWSQTEYAAFSNRAASFSAAVGRSVQAASIGWNGGDQLLNYRIEYTIPRARGRSMFRYGGAMLSVSPIGPTWTIGGGWSRRPGGLGTGVTVQDFAATVDDDQESTTWHLHTALRPWAIATIRGKWSERWSTDDGRSTGYTLPHRSGEYGFRAGISEIQLHGVDLSVSYANTRAVLSATAELQRTLFGDVAGGTGTMREWSAAAGWRVGEMPVRLSGRWIAAGVNAVGHVESWPFTTLAATVFNNRMYYVLDGSLDLVTIAGETALDAGDVQIGPSVAWSRLWTDIRVTHWEPEFLIFGVKNRRIDPVPLARCSAITLSCDVRLPFLGGHLVLTALQVVPFALVERAIPATGEAPPPSSGPSVSSSMDGGRRVQISWRTP